MAQFEAVFDYGDENTPAQWLVIEWISVDENVRKGQIWDQFQGKDAEREATATAELLQEYDDYSGDYDALEEFPMGEFPY